MKSIFTFCFFLFYLISFVFGGATVINPFPYQIDGNSTLSSVKFTSFDVSPSLTLNSLIVSITWFRSDSQICTNPSSTAGHFAQTSFTLILNDKNGNQIANVSLSPSAGYTNNFIAQKSTGLIVQTFTSYSNSIDNFNIPQYGFYSPADYFAGIFSKFGNAKLIDSQWQLLATDNVLDGNYLCLAEFEVTVNCAARAIIYKQDLNIYSIDNNNFNFNSGTQFLSQKALPLDNAITYVTVTLTWTKATFGNTCASPGTNGNRQPQNLAAFLTFQSAYLGQTITATLVGLGTWTNSTNTASAYYSTTFDSNSINRYPSDIRSGLIQPYGSLTVFNGLSPWGVWTVTVEDTDTGYTTCIFGVRISISTCTPNGSCLCIPLQTDIDTETVGTINAANKPFSFSV